jgi:hypothetical protein
MRTLAAVVVGFLVVFLLLATVEMFSTVVHPFPEGFGGTMEEIYRQVERYPHWVLAVVVPLWGFTAFVGTWIARKIGNLCSALIVGLSLVAAAGCNVLTLPYPAWFKIVTLLVIPVAVVAGSRKSLRPDSASTNEPTAPAP